MKVFARKGEPLEMVACRNQIPKRGLRWGHVAGRGPIGPIEWPASIVALRGDKQIAHE